MNSIFEIHDTIKDEAVYGRYVTHRHVLKKLADLPLDYNVETIGKSVQGRSIESITIGHGPIKILMWSQMHGNESTTTKAVFDLLSFLDSDNELAKQILTNCNLRIIPMLNPDGAEVYTRVNANEVDLNRDAQNLSQPESVVLRNIFLDFKPDFCFNLHDQRTIFNVGESNQPATVSFLAPAHDEDRSVSPTRAKSMKLIVAMNDCLQQKIPGRVGRYDDSFNANCVGDTFQMTKTPTILFESGHSPNDYDREETRKYIFAALCEGLKVISLNIVDDFSKDDYFVIPENNKLFVDFIIENPAEHFAISEELNEPKLFLFKEVLQNGNIEFIPELQPNIHQTIFAHKYFNCAINDDLQALKSQFYYSDVRNVFETLS